MTYFKNKTVIMSGGSRGVGLEIAKALGKDGANIAILAKTTEPHNSVILDMNNLVDCSRYLK